MLSTIMCVGAETGAGRDFSMRESYRPRDTLVCAQANTFRCTQASGNIEQRPSCENELGRSMNCSQQTTTSQTGLRSDVLYSFCAVVLQAGSVARGPLYVM